MNEQIPAIWERRLEEGLGVLAESEAPGPTITVEGLIASGRRARQRRRNRGVFALTAVLVAATALTFGTVALTAHGGTPSPPVNTSPSPTHKASVGANAGPTVTDLAFGWLPSDMQNTNSVDYYAPGTGFTPSTGADSGLTMTDGPGGSSLEAWSSDSGMVTLSASIEGPGAGIGSGVHLTPAGTVDGHQAWWANDTPGSAQTGPIGWLILYWQYEPGDWASVMYGGTPDTASGAMMLHVASALVIGPTKPYALPFRIPSLPAGFHPFSFNVNLPEPHGSQYGDGTLILCLKNPCAVSFHDPHGGLLVSQQPTTWLGGQQIALNDAPSLVPGTDTPMQDSPGLSHRTVAVDGHTATLFTEATGATLTFDYDGTTVLVAASDREYQALGGESGFLAFCRTVDWLGPNPAQWTTDPVG